MLPKSQIHKRRSSPHPLVETVWQTQNLRDGVYLATPDAAWDLIVLIDEDGSKRLMVTGQATKPMQVPYKAGTGSVVISFKPGVYSPLFPAKEMIDAVKILPNADDDHFSIAGHVFAFPTFDTVETLVERLVNLDLLKYDEVVGGKLDGAGKAMSERNIQRHFVQTTGLSEKYLAQIRRAQTAIRQLQQGKKPSDVAAETGYTDQPHLAKSLKKIMNRKPSDVDEIHKI